MAFAAYAALREKVPELPAIASRDTLKTALEIAEVYLSRPLWTDEEGFCDEWHGIRCELANQRFELKRARKPIARAVQLDGNVEEAVERLLAKAPAAMRSAVAPFLAMRMPIDHWIELTRVAEDLLAEVIAADEPTAPPPAAPPAAAAATSAASGPECPRPSAPRAADTSTDHRAAPDEASQ